MKTSNYLTRYKGTYRLKVPTCETTNDFPKKLNGTYEDIDMYIPCASGGQIYSYGHGILVAYIPSIGRGHNIIKSLAKELISEDFVEKECNEVTYNKNNEPVNHYDYEKIYDGVLKEGTIRDIMENDVEVEIKLHAKDIDLIAKYIKPSTFGASISPFSTKNLPKRKEKYSAISADEMREYESILNQIPKDELLKLSRLTSRFITDILQNKRQYKQLDIKADMRKKMLKGKEYIHSMGLWNEYIKYLKENI